MVRLAQRLRARPTQGRPVRSRAALGTAGLLLLLFALMLLLVQDRWSPLAEVDAGAGDVLHRFAAAHPWFVRSMLTVSLLGSGWVWWGAALVALLQMLRCRRRSTALFLAATGLGSLALNRIVKALVHRARPVVAHPVDRVGGFSFPSGHAQSAVVGYTIVLLLLLPPLAGGWRLLAVAMAVLMVLAIGFSRIALGVHFVSDVLAGYALGGAWGLVMAAAFDVRPVATARLRPAEGSPR